MAQTLIAALFALLVASAPIRARQQDGEGAEVELRSDLVELRVTVSSPAGGLVTGLAKDDFDVVEDGTSRDIAFFSANAVATYEARAGREVLVPTSPVPIATLAKPSRTIALFVDTLHTDPASLANTRTALRKFIDTSVRDGDVVGLISSGGDTGPLGLFTTDKKLMRLAVDRLRVDSGHSRSGSMTAYLASQAERDSQAFAVADAIFGSEDILHTPSLTIPKSRQYLAEAQTRTASTLAVLHAVIDRLSAAPGDRVLALISDGFSLQNIAGGASLNDLRNIVGHATRSGIVVYSLAAQGIMALDKAGADTIATAAVHPAFSSTMTAARHDVESAMRDLAEHTGGAFIRSNDLGGALDRVARETGASYVLGFYPDSSESASARRVTVRVRNRPELIVHGADRYERESRSDAGAKRADERSDLVRAMLSPLPAAEIGVSARTTYLEVPTDSARASLEVTIDGRALAYHDDAGRHRFDLQVAVCAFDADGRLSHGDSRTVTGRLTADEQAEATRLGFTYERRLELTPGTHQIRVGVRDTATGRIGTTVAFVEIPDRSRQPLTLSGLVLRGGSSDRLTTLGGIPFAHRGDTVVYTLMIYGPRSVDPERADLRTRVRIEHDGVAVFEGIWKPIATRAVQSDARGLQVSSAVQIGELPSGVYELVVDIAGKANRTPLSQRLEFGVE